MKTAHFTAVRQITVSDAEPPRLERPEDVIVRIDRMGVCGSDVHYYTHGRIGDQVVQYPATLGHECAGTVVEVGTAAKGVYVGDRVAIDPALACGQCDQCRAGRGNTCRNLKFMGCPGEAPGVAAELLVVPAGNCYPVPDSMSLDQAALIEPLSIGLYAVRLRRLETGARIGILGAGPIGLSVLLCAKLLAPCKAYVTDLIESRLEVARACGADWIGNAAQDDCTAAIREESPLGLSLVFECSGDPACINQGLELLAPGGTLLLVGIPPTEQVSYNSHLVRRHELSLQAVRRQFGCVAPVIHAVADGSINTEPLVTHHFPLDRIGDAFELVAGYRDGVIKALVKLSDAETQGAQE